MSTATHIHLKRLEAESIRIFRQVAADFERPVMLYSVGKDSSVLLHLAMKAFYPSKPPFPLLHVDTRWKFKEMIAFRDATAERLGLELIVHTNQEGLCENINPFTHGSSRYTDVMKTQALKQALDAGKYDAAMCPTGRRKIPGQGAGVFTSIKKPRLGSQEPAPGAVVAL